MPIIKKQTTHRLSPAKMLTLGFSVIIAVGTFLLWLPISSKTGEFTSIFDCLFTATSATCVTGITIYDTYAHWSLFGQLVIALMVQIGGLGIVTIITFFNMAAGKKLGFRTMAAASDGLTENSFESGGNILISIIKYSLIIELAGSLILMTAFIPQHGVYGIWMGIFFSINAFCNAGFDLCVAEGEFTSLIAYNDNPLVLITISLLVIAGGLGFIVWENLFNLRKTKKLNLHTKAVLLMSGILLLGGTIFYLSTEWNNPATLGEMNVGQKLLNAFFSSVSARSVGYSSISVSDMSDFSQMGTMMLMFIGSAPASTGGGIKITTVLVLVMTVVSYIKNKNDVEIMHHKIDKLTVYRTLVITVLSFGAVILCFSALYFTLPEGTDISGIQCLFEAIAAFSTAGISMGIAGTTGGLVRIVLMISMFAGRIGPISLIMSLVLSNNKRKDIIVPDGQILIG